MEVLEYFTDDLKEGKVTAWLHGVTVNTGEMFKRPAIIICPGGGYFMTSATEAEPVAEFYFAAGYQTFILNYSVQDKAKGFKPLMQLADTIADIRKNAEKWHIEKEKIAVCGFSAGAHLACSLGTLFNEKKFLDIYNKNEDIRPNAMVLGYPVILADEYAHQDSIKTVSGSDIDTDEYKWFSLNNHVDEQTSPAFLFHTAADAAVPVENSLKMAMALSAKNIPYELHVFPKGQHGMTVCTNDVTTKNDYNFRWIEWSIKWLNEVLDYSR